MKNRSVVAQVFSGLLLTVVALALTACGQDLYRSPEFNYAGRPLPPSLLQQRVLASFTANGSQGGLVMLDGLRDLRRNIQRTILSFPISGYSGGNPVSIINYPEQSVGYVFSTSDGSLTAINYAKESSSGVVATFSPTSPSVAAVPTGARFLSAQEGAGQLVLIGSDGTYALNLPDVDKVVVNPGNSVILATVRNSDALYRVVRLNATSTPIAPPYPAGSPYVDCQPVLLPVYCVVKVPQTAPTAPGLLSVFDRPSDVYFSLDGNTAYVLNCGPECGGTKSGVTALEAGALTIDVIPDLASTPATAPLSPIPGPNPISIPGGVTAAISDGPSLYLAGQSLYDQSASGALLTTPRANGLFSGYLTTVNLSTYAVANPVSISDGHHSKMLLADDGTLWVGSQQCANGERQYLSTQGVTDQTANYNCLSMVVLKAGALPVAQIVPNAVVGTNNLVPYPNTNGDQYYYGSLTGICWVQYFHKVYTAYGGQIHAFYTGGTITDDRDPAFGTTPAAGTEDNNFNITVQGTVLDVAYMDATNNVAN